MRPYNSVIMKFATAPSGPGTEAGEAVGLA